MNVSQNDNMAAPSAAGQDAISLFGGKVIIGVRRLAVLKVAVPLAVIALCAVITAVMIYFSFANAGNIDGRFVLSGSSNSSYIDLDSGGAYTMNLAGEKQSGEWHFEGSRLVFVSSSGEKTAACFVDRKYIALEDASFLVGVIPEGAAFDAEVKSADGETYTFKADGKFYVTEDGRNTELGSYIIDGLFIIVTTKDGSITYLNCCDGITSVFYQAA